MNRIKYPKVRKTMNKIKYPKVRNAMDIMKYQKARILMQIANIGTSIRCSFDQVIITPQSKIIDISRSKSIA